MVEENQPSEEIVSKETTSTGEDTGEAIVTPEPTQPQPFSEEQEARMQQLLAEATTQAAEKGRREMQGIKDREVAAAERRAKQAEAETSAYKTGFGNLDEETQKEIENARIRSENTFYKSQAQVEQEAKQRGEYETSFMESLDSELESLGIDPKDERVDKALDASGYFEGRKRFTASVSKILKEKDKVAEKTIKEQIDEAVNKRLVEEGLESVDKSASGGVEKTDLDKIIEDYGEGKASRAQYEEAMKKKGLEP